MFGYLDGLADDIMTYVLKYVIVGLCLFGGLVIFAYKLNKWSKQPPPAPDNDENSKD